MKLRLGIDLQKTKTNYYQPILWVADTDERGALTHLRAKAHFEKLADYGITPDADLKQIFEAVAALEPAWFEKKYNKPGAKKIIELARLMEEPLVKKYVLQTASERLSKILALTQKTGLWLTKDAVGKPVPEHARMYHNDAKVIPVLQFVKHAEGMNYTLKLQCATMDGGQEFLPIQQTIPLTNTDPAWVLFANQLVGIAGINGNMIPTFADKTVVTVKKEMVGAYLKKFMLRNVASESVVETEGFDLVESQDLIKTTLTLCAPFLDNFWYLSVNYHYRHATFHPGDVRISATQVIYADQAANDFSFVKDIRDLAAEQAQLDVMEQLGLVRTDNRFHLADTQTNSPKPLLNWLTQHKAELAQKGFDIVAKWTADEVELALDYGYLEGDVRESGDWFDIEKVVVVGQYRIRFKQFVPFLRSGNALFPLPNGHYFYIPEEWFTDYADLAAEIDMEGEDARLHRSKAQLLPEIWTEKEAVATTETDTQTDVLQSSPVPWNAGTYLHAELRPYQKKGVEWMLALLEQGNGVCLADDMGLGKTLQTISVMTHYKNHLTAQRVVNAHELAGQQLNLFQTYEETLQPLRALVVMPASLIFNWHRELQRFAPNLLLYAHVGASRHKDIRPITAHDVVLTTYQTAREDEALLAKGDWQIMVLDEAQYIKNKDAQISKVVRNGIKSVRKIALSGTPIENSLSDMWTLMHYMNPQLLGNYSQFREKYLVPIEQGGEESAKRRLAKMVKPYFLRRRKEEVAPELPPLEEQIFYVEMPADQRKFYERIKSAARNEILALFEQSGTRLLAIQALMKLRQSACHPSLAYPEYEGASGKVSAVLEELQIVLENKRKVLVFSTFAKHLELIEHACQKQSWKYCKITGEVATKDRAKVVQQFQEDADTHIFLLTLKAAGVGLNLTAADYVFLIDPWWNPFAENQAIARAHRIGQDKPVTAIRFITRDTVEEKVLVLQEKKRKLGQLLEDDELYTEKMTLEDMTLLLEG